MMLGHTYAMRKHGFGKAVVAAMIVGSSLSIPVQAMAEPTPTPSPEVSRSPMEQFKFDRENYLIAIKLRSQQIRFINQGFKNACDKAALDFKAAMSIAKTPDQKNQASNARKNAINSAILTRDAAIAALGAEPTPPTEPIKPMKISGKGKSRN